MALFRLRRPNVTLARDDAPGGTAAKDIVDIRPFNQHQVGRIPDVQSCFAATNALNEIHRIF